MAKDLTICGNHKLGCDCTNWDEYRRDKERKRKQTMDNKVREIIVDALFNNNFKVNYAGDLSKFTRELDDKLEIKIKV